jgi:hypothetical protein
VQAQPGAFDIDDIGAAEESAEEVLLVFGGNPDAFVEDGYPDAASGSWLGLNLNRCAFVGEFDGIAEQVDEDVLYQSLVTCELPFFGAMAMNVLIFLGKGLHFFGDFFQQIA